MAAGFVFGKVLLRRDRRKWILILGITATALFFALRGINLCGNGLPMVHGTQKPASGLDLAELSIRGRRLITSRLCKSMVSLLDQKRRCV
jgi:hypothetical protein